MNEYFIYQNTDTIQQNSKEQTDWTERFKKHLQLSYNGSITVSWVGLRNLLCRLLLYKK